MKCIKDNKTKEMASNDSIVLQFLVLFLARHVIFLQPLLFISWGLIHALLLQ